MSVNITIENNEAYCRKHCPEKIRAEVYECQCADLEDGPFDDCYICKGSGIVGYEEMPFFFNMANGNFSRLWSAMGLEVDYCGSIDGRTLLEALQTMDPMLVLREGREYRDEFFRCQAIEGGITASQVARYVTEISAICHAAIKREERIIWN